MEWKSLETFALVYQNINPIDVNDNMLNKFNFKKKVFP